MNIPEKERYLEIIQANNPPYRLRSIKSIFKTMAQIKSDISLDELDTIEIINMILEHRYVSISTIRTYMYYINNYKIWVRDKNCEKDKIKKHIINRGLRFISLTYPSEDETDKELLTLKDTNYVKKTEEIMVYGITDLLNYLRPVFTSRSSLSDSLASITRDEVVTLYCCLMYLGIKKSDIFDIKLRDVKEDANGRITITYKNNMILIPNDLKWLMLKSIYAEECLSFDRSRLDHKFHRAPISNTERLITFNERYTSIQMRCNMSQYISAQFRKYKNTPAIVAKGIEKRLYGNNLYDIGQIYFYNMYIKKHGINFTKKGIINHMKMCEDSLITIDKITQAMIFRELLDKEMDYSNINDYGVEFETIKLDYIYGYIKPFIDNDTVKLNTDKIRKMKGYDDLNDDFKEFVDNNEDTLFHVKIIQIYVLNFKACYVSLKEATRYRFIQTDLIKVIK